MTTNIKILHISITSEIGGGPEHLFQLVTNLDSRFENFICLPSNGPYFNKIKTVVNEKKIFIIPHRKFSILKAYELLNFIKNNNIKIIHSHGKGASIYLRFIKIILKNNIKTVHTPHGINNFKTIKLKNILYFFFEKLFGDFIDHIVYVSKSEKKLAINLKLWKKNPNSTIFNGSKIFTDFEIENLRLNNINNKLFNKINIIQCSRFDYQKNSIEFAKIAMELPEYNFIILGDGILKKNLQNFILKNNIKNINILGNVPNPINYIAKCDLYLSTSIFEGLSMAILESMSIGTPIIASNVTGNIDLVKNNYNGFLYELGNINDALLKIKKIIKNKKIKTFRNNTKKFHNTYFSNLKMAINTSKIYNSLLNENN